jgi:hypothetical protein
MTIPYERTRALSGVEPVERHSRRSACDSCYDERVMTPLMRLIAKLNRLSMRRPSGITLMDMARSNEQLAAEGVSLLGRRGWGLLRSYGRVMSGTYSGLYVSALPAAEVRTLLMALKRGERIPVHLMHRHRSGCYESSRLSLTEGRLLMHYPDRTEPAE